MKNIFIKTVERLKNLSESDIAEEFSGQYQGDIIISDEEIEEIENNRRTATVDEKRLWPNAIIPYRVNESHFSKNYEKCSLKAFKLSIFNSFGANRLHSSRCTKADGSVLLEVCGLRSRTAHRLRYR